MALAVVRAISCTSHIVTDCSFQVKVVTIGVALGSKVDTRLCIGRNKAIPVIKNSKNCLLTLIVLAVYM